MRLRLKYSSSGKADRRSWKCMSRCRRADVGLQIGSFAFAFWAEFRRFSYMVAGLVVHFILHTSSIERWRSRSPIGAGYICVYLLRVQRLPFTSPSNLLSTLQVILLFRRCLLLALSYLYSSPESRVFNKIDVEPCLAQSVEDQHSSSACRRKPWDARDDEPRPQGPGGGPSLVVKGGGSSFKNECGSS